MSIYQGVKNKNSKTNKNNSKTQNRIKTKCQMVEKELGGNKPVENPIPKSL